MYGEKRISVEGEKEGEKIEYRVWNPFRCVLPEDLHHQQWSSSCKQHWSPVHQHAAIIQHWFAQDATCDHAHQRRRVNDNKA